MGPCAGSRRAGRSRSARGRQALALRELRGHPERGRARRLHRASSSTAATMMRRCIGRPAHDQGRAQGPHDEQARAARRRGVAEGVGQGRSWEPPGVSARRPTIAPPASGVNPRPRPRAATRRRGVASCAGRAPRPPVVSASQLHAWAGICTYPASAPRLARALESWASDQGGHPMRKIIAVVNVSLLALAVGVVAAAAAPPAKSTSSPTKSSSSTAPKPAKASAPATLRERHHRVLRRHGQDPDREGHEVHLDLQRVQRPGLGRVQEHRRRRALFAHRRQGDGEVHRSRWTEVGQRSVRLAAAHAAKASAEVQSSPGLPSLPSGVQI